MRRLSEINSTIADLQIKRREFSFNIFSPHNFILFIFHLQVSQGVISFLSDRGINVRTIHFRVSNGVSLGDLISIVHFIRTNV